MRHSALVIRATQDAKHLNGALVILIISFAAYLIGLFFELFDDVAAKTIAVVGIVVCGLFLSLFFVHRDRTVLADYHTCRSNNRDSFL